MQPAKSDRLYPNGTERLRLCAWQNILSILGLQVQAATPNILTQLKAVKKAGRKLTGTRSRTPSTGVNIPGYIANDPVLQSIIRGSQRVAERRSRRKSPPASAT